MYFCREMASCAPFFHPLFWTDYRIDICLALSIGLRLNDIAEILKIIINKLKILQSSGQIQKYLMCAAFTEHRVSFLKRKL